MRWQNDNRKIRGERTRNEKKHSDDRVKMSDK